MSRQGDYKFLFSVQYWNNRAIRESGIVEVSYAETEGLGDPRDVAVNKVRVFYENNAQISDVRVMIHPLII